MKDNHTHRLALDAPRLADVPDLISFLGDKAAMRWTQAHETPRALRRFLAAHACQRCKTGFGPWTIRRRDNHEVIGLGGIYDDPFDPGYGLEIAYWFAPSARGQGYATELVRHSLNVAWSRGLPSLRAFAHPENTSSQRVLEKTGFTRVGYVKELNRHDYRCLRPES